jgi:hypothetical protein
MFIIIEKHWLDMFFYLVEERGIGLQITETYLKLEGQLGVRRSIVYWDFGFLIQCTISIL